MKLPAMENCRKCAGYAYFTVYYQAINFLLQWLLKVYSILPCFVHSLQLLRNAIYMLTCK